MIAPLTLPPELSDEKLARLKSLAGVQRGVLILGLTGIAVIFCTLGAIGLVMYYRITLRNLRGDMHVNRIFESVTRLRKEQLKLLAKENTSRGIAASIIRYEWVQWLPYGALAVQIMIVYLLLPYLPH
ncbi:MAG: hypothetical protein SFY80_12025 [Verrucomicrobiota bacterium]|nr:hypothetical protein [Verrucomicrobiota bacterium]